MSKKELFETSILKLENQFDIDNKCHDSFSVILPNDYVSGYDNNILIDGFIDMITYIAGGFDNFKFNKELLEYYIYELNFGSEYYDGCLKDETGNIKLSNSDELWDALTKC